MLASSGRQAHRGCGLLPLATSDEPVDERPYSRLLLNLMVELLRSVMDLTVFVAGEPVTLA